MTLGARVQGGRERLTADGLRERSTGARVQRRWYLSSKMGRVAIEPAEAEYMADVMDWASDLERVALRLIAANRSLQALDDPLREMADILALKP